MALTLVKSEADSWQLQWIDSVAKLEAIISELAQEELLSIDTETVGWDTGNERLCLIQIGAPTTKTIFIIDVVTLVDIKALEPILSKPTPRLVAHNAPFEEKQFGRYGIKLRGVIDTLNMSRRLRPDLPNHTLQTCCRFLIGRLISKEEQTSNWALRPLSPEQIRYAALDAEVTIELYLVLRSMEEKLELDPKLAVSDLMGQLCRTVSSRLKLTESIAAELAILNAREEMIRQAIRTKLIDGEAPYDGPFGRCKVTKIKKTEINPERVRREMPEIAELVISEYVEKERIQAIMREHGIDEGKLEAVTDIIGYTDRLNLSLKELE